MVLEIFTDTFTYAGGEVRKGGAGNIHNLFGIAKNVHMFHHLEDL